MLHVRVGNVDFFGHTNLGFLIGPGGFRGWEGASATKRDAPERVGRHGAFDAPAYKSARLVTLSGSALARSEAELEQMEDVLSGVGQSKQRVVVTSAKGARWADGSVEGEITWDRVGGMLEADYKLSLLFADPFKYGETRTFVSTGSDVQVWHRGNTRAFGVLTVRGSDPLGYRVAHPGGSYRVTAPLTSSQTDVIDFRRGSYTKNGTAMDTAMTDADRFTVPGGRSTPFRIEPITSGASLTATLALTDTFI